MRRKGFTLIELLIVIAIIGMLIAILLPNLGAALELTKRATCSANLRSIGQSIKVYSSGNRGHWPSVYAKDDNGAVWGEGWGSDNTEITDCQLDQDAKKMDGYIYTCNLSNWWLLIRMGLSKPGVFICPSARGNEEDPTIDEVDAAWSFHYLENCSYSYQNQLKKPTTDSAESDMVIAADVNPQRGDVFDEESTRSLDKDKTDRWEFNSPNHKFEGQNCLYADDHVTFETTPYVGYGKNNIWVRDDYDRAEVSGKRWKARASYGDTGDGITNRNDSWLVP